MTQTAVATAILRRLTGGRWTWPPVRVREKYPAPVGKLMLRGRPIRKLYSIIDRDGNDIPYELYQNGLVELNPASGCVRGDVTVEYEYGSQPPMVMQQAIDVFAAELEKSINGDRDCRLPDRVTSMTRQGVTYTYTDADTLIQNGRTGIYEIDLAIRAVGSPRMRARAYSPEFPPPKRISTTVVPTVPLTLVAGDEFKLTVLYYDSSGYPAATPGGSAVMTLEAGETTHVVPFDVPDGSEALHATASPATTATWSAGTYRLKVVYTPTEGAPTVIYANDLVVT